MMQQIYYDFIKHFMCFPEFSEQLFYLFEFSSIFLNFLDFSMGKQFPSSQIRRGDHQPAGEGVPQGWERQVFPRGGSLAPGHHPLVAKLALRDNGIKYLHDVIIIIFKGSMYVSSFLSKIR